MKAPSPLLGFNNNVRHKGRVFHIQTEDSGIRHPHIITHLFADGGRILKTAKTSYAEHVGQAKLAEIVRGMMQDQHKAMFMALRDGQFDHLFEEGTSASSPKLASAAASPLPLAVPVPPTPPTAPALPSPVAPAPPSPTAPVVRQVRATPRVHPAVEAPPSRRHAPPASLAKDPPPPPGLSPLASEPATDPAPHSRRRSSGRPRLDVDTAALHGVVVTPTNREPAVDLDLDALERAAAEAQTPYYQQIQNLPPPPAAVLGGRRTSPGGPGGYSVRTPITTAQPPAPSQRLRPTTSTTTNGRYAPSRPASIFATNRPQEGTSIFGEDLISEKSLDEVILSYLAEDLDGPNDKK